jgi:hypothetical protein
MRHVSTGSFVLFVLVLVLGPARATASEGVEVVLEKHPSMPGSASLMLKNALWRLDPKVERYGGGQPVLTMSGVFFEKYVDKNGKPFKAKPSDWKKVPLSIALPVGLAQRVVAAAKKGGIRVTTGMDYATGSMVRVIAGEGKDTVIIDRMKRAGPNGMDSTRGLRVQLGVGEAAVAMKLDRATSGKNLGDGWFTKGPGVARSGKSMLIDPSSQDLQRSPKAKLNGSETQWFVKALRGKNLTTDIAGQIGYSARGGGANDDARWLTNAKATLKVRLDKVARRKARKSGSPQTAALLGVIDQHLRAEGSTRVSEPKVTVYDQDGRPALRNPYDALSMARRGLGGDLRMSMYESYHGATSIFAPHSGPFSSSKYSKMVGSQRSVTRTSSGAVVTQLEVIKVAKKPTTLRTKKVNRHDVIANEKVGTSIKVGGAVLQVTRRSRRLGKGTAVLRSAVSSNTRMSKTSWFEQPTRTLSVRQVRLGYKRAGKR